MNTATAGAVASGAGDAAAALLYLGLIGFRAQPGKASLGPWLSIM